MEVPTVESPSAVAALTKSFVPEDQTSEEQFRLTELSIFEQMLRTIQKMVESNRQEIQSLKCELASRKSRREDTTRIEARLADEERRSQALLDRLAETESRLATSEAQIQKQKALEFTEIELAELQKYSTIIVFDT